MNRRKRRKERTEEREMGTIDMEKKKLVDEEDLEMEDSERRKGAMIM